MAIFLASPELAGGGVVILMSIGMWTTVTHGEFVRRAGPLPVWKDRQQR